MNYFRICSMALVTFVCLAGDATSATINVDLNDPNYYRSFSTLELVPKDGIYKFDFIDTFVFALTENGSLSFILSEKDNRGMFSPNWVDITDVGFTNGSAPTSVTPWEKKDPHYNQSNLVRTFTWDFLTAGTYNLSVTGTAYASDYPFTHYWMEKGSLGPSTGLDPIPESATMALAGLSLLGITGLSRLRRRK